jgi:hypothetical protein
VLLRRLLPGGVAEVFYLDFGTASQLAARKLRLLDRRFLSLPAQAVRARLWGLRRGAAGGGRAALLELVREGNRTRGGLLAKVVTGGERPGLWLLDNTGPGEGEESINTRLVREGAAGWNTEDLARLGPAVEPEDEEAGWRAERLNLLEVQRALVLLLPEGEARARLLGRLGEAQGRLGEAQGRLGPAPECLQLPPSWKIYPKLPPAKY